MHPPAEQAGAILTIDPGALVENYQRLCRRVAPALVGGVVKANAYGLGVAVVAPALFAAGCRQFFVAHLAEALELRPLIPATAAIHVLNGLPAGSEGTAADHGITPVLNSSAEARAWQRLAEARGRPLPAILQVDSGMARLGLPEEETRALAADAAFRAAVPLLYIMSHLACADHPADAANEAQRASFARQAALFPGVKRSLANSGGCLLDARFHGDLARAGIALYGGDPQSALQEPFAPVVRLDARVIQIRTISDGAGVGYGLSWRARGKRRIATLSVGYADGWPRHLSNKGAAYCGDTRLPIAGRVSMDSMSVDITALPDGALREGAFVELLGPHQRLDDVAQDAGTIAYEILTGLGRRYHRRILAAGPATPARTETENIA